VVSFLSPKGGCGTNLQNIPRSDVVVKKAFLPKLDAFLGFDYAQIELRMLAFYMARLGDPSMAQAIWDGKDLHTESATAALGTAAPITDEQRQVGKVLNFSMVYGGGRPTLMRQLGISFPEATQLLRKFHARWPGIQIVQNVISQQIAARTTPDEPGYITTLWGRHLHPESEHKALNALVQGCSADLMRAALVKVHRHLGSNLMASHLVLTTHDDLMIDAARAEIPYLVEVVPTLMDHPPVSAVVPIESDCEISFTTWAGKASYQREAVLEGV
jgi:DNA polymerase-1